MYVPLWTKSHFSFLEGASPPEALVQAADAMGLPALALGDANGLYGLPRAWMRSRVSGCRVRVLVAAQTSVAELGEPLVLLAQTRAGYTNLCRLLTAGQGRCPKGQAQVFLHEVEALQEGLICLSADLGSMAQLHAAFGDRLYARMARHRLPHEPAQERARLFVAESLGVLPVAAPEVLYHDRTLCEVQDVLTCIRLRRRLAEGHMCLRANAEYALLSAEAMTKLYRDVPTWVARTCEVAARCTFDLKQLTYRYPAPNLGSVLSTGAQLRQKAEEGLTWRYGTDVPVQARTQLGVELDLIEELSYGGYFLSMWEIVAFCREHGILCQGRGSAANSVVCYCLGITAVDPVQTRLLFARFLSRERAEPPDIDLDIEHHRREEVIQWVYRRYGKRHAAMVANVVRFRWRSAIREVGATLGLPATNLDRLAKLLGYGDASLANGFDAQMLGAAGLSPDATACRQLWRLASAILDYPRHLSVHPGGFLLGADPLETLVPIEPAHMQNRTVIQWDKHDVENLGLFKIDLLGLGALHCVHLCFDLIAQTGGGAFTLANVPQHDAATYAMLSRGDSVGVFQVESRAQMAMLPRLAPKIFYDLVVQVAIVRPGPIQGNMVHPYLQRRARGETISYPHPSFADILDKTYGVPIFQEQVMKLAMVAADYSPAEADILRRDMAAWRSSDRIERHHRRLTEAMVQKGVPAEFAEGVFAQIRGFGEYGFPESHAASFALIVYVTAWLRCHHPAAFACALLQAQPMGFYSPATIVHDARRHGVTILPIDINKSLWACSLQPWLAPDRGASKTCAVRMGLNYVRGFGSPEHAAWQRSPGPFRDVPDLVRRSQLSAKALIALAQAGGLDGISPTHRRATLWQLRGLLAERHDGLNFGAARSEHQTTLFARLPVSEQVLWDFRHSAHSARGHPMQSVRPGLPTHVLDAASIGRASVQNRVTCVGMVICRQRPQTAHGVTFLTLEDETGFVNIVLWLKVYQAHRILAKTASLLGVTGTLQRAHGVTHIIADTLFAPQHPTNTPTLPPREFLEAR